MCAAVALSALAADDGTSSITMKVRNLSGLFGSYAGSVLTALGLKDLSGARPIHLGITGSCFPSDKDCAARWSVAVGGTRATMGDGIGLVDLKLSTAGVLGGIASDCAATVNQLDHNGNPVMVPRNPDGLFMTGCNSDDWVTYSFSAITPVDVNAVQISLRSQHGYPNGSGMVKCVYPASVDQPGCTLMSSTAVTPEPASMLLLATGLLGLAFAKRRHRSANTDAC